MLQQNLHECSYRRKISGMRACNSDWKELTDKFIKKYKLELFLLFKIPCCIENADISWKTAAIGVAIA